MEDFIESMMILKKYANVTRNPFNCAHDELFFCAIDDISKVSEEDRVLLEKLGWNINDDYEEISSFRYGSC